MSDKLAYKLGLIDTKLLFEKAREPRINERAARYADDPAFSLRIRARSSGPRREIEGGDQRIEKLHSFHATRVLEVFRENRGDLVQTSGCPD